MLANNFNCADIDIKSIPDLQADKFTKTIQKQNGNKIPAPDLRKDRQCQLFKELLKPKYIVHGFKTSDLLSSLSNFFRNPAQIRHELQKLISRDLIIKVKNRNFYRVTHNGWKWFWIQICSKMYFQDPINSRLLKNEFKNACSQPSKIEQAYNLLDQGLNLFTQEVACI